MGRLRMRLALGATALLFASAASGDAPLITAPESATALDLKEDIFMRIEKQYLYLQNLENLQAALERELEIAKLMRECEKTGMLCTGEGLVPIPEPPPAAPLPQPQAKPTVATVALPADLSVRGVVGGEALIEYRGRKMAVRTGDKIGDWTVREVRLDFLEFERDGRRLRMLIEKGAAGEKAREEE